VAAVTVASFVGASLSPGITRHVPPVLAALIPGAVAVVVCGEIHGQSALTLAVAVPHLYAPHFSLRAMLELVLPLVVTVVATQNAQGSAVLLAAGYRPPINTLTLLCGLGSCLFALFGSVPTCVTGPANAILVSAGVRGTHYIGGIVFGLCMLVFGVFAPTATRLALALPLSFIGLIGGLAMLHVLRNAFNVAFSTHFQLGALVAFLITLADVQIYHIGAPFWGLAGGFGTSWLLERQAFHVLQDNHAGHSSG
jgi:benzoate membrane transport protein